MSVAGKLGGQQAGAAPVAAGTASSAGNAGRLMYLQNELDKTFLLVDSGAAYSVVPVKSSAPSCGPSLSGADGASIKCWGRRSEAIVAGGRRFQWSFSEAAVSFPMLGADFLRYNKLILNFADSTLKTQEGDWIYKLHEPGSRAQFSVIQVADPPIQESGSGGVVAAVAISDKPKV
jgi:hypothetical protein